MRRNLRSVAVAVLCAGAAANCKPRESSPAPEATPKPAPEPAARIAARQAWRAEQDRTMRSELSPLSRVDYVHLPAGEHVVKAGAPPLNLSADALAPYSGELRLKIADGHFTFTAAPPLALNGTPTDKAELSSGNVLALGRLRLLVSNVPKDPSLAIYDPQAPSRRAYSGLHYYPDNAEYVTRGQLTRYAEPRTVRVAATRGEDREQLAVGTLNFTLRGQSASMEAYAEQPGSNRLFLIFRDATCGQPGKSYGAGRYLYATASTDGSVELDFNQTWNPLCAYSPFFHCPIPPRTNWFKFEIPVGEKLYAEH